MNMDWISVKDRFPEDRIAVLGFCVNLDDHIEWNGIVHVYFERSTGWKRCELFDKKPIKVFYWNKDFKKPEEFM